jgi:hypothetical protein
METIFNSNGTPPNVAKGAGGMSQKIYQLPDRTCFLVHLRLVGDHVGEELRVVTWCVSALTSLLKAKDALSAEIHMVRPRADWHDAPTLQRVTEVHLCDGAACIFRLDTGEQFVSVDDEEPVAMVCLCCESDDAA